VPVLAHRDLRDAVVPRFTARLRLHLHLLELARVEHTIELAFQEIARLAVQHLEDLATHGVLAGHALRPGLALAVPGADAVATVDHVQPDRKGVDDLRGASISWVRSATSEARSCESSVAAIMGARMRAATTTTSWAIPS